MIIKITHDFNKNFIWELYDGPDGIDYFTGYGETLGDCFESIISTRTLNALSYRECETNE